MIFQSVGTQRRRVVRFIGILGLVLLACLGGAVVACVGDDPAPVNATGADASGAADAAQEGSLAPDAADASSEGSADAGSDACGAPGDASALHFVDPSSGTDDPNHGGGYGSCGYKTLTYALTRAKGQIALQTATYSPASGETLPFVLKDTQQLLCKYMTTAPAKIEGRGIFLGVNANVNVAFIGTQNGLKDCIVDGVSGAGYCIDVFASAAAASPHTITNVDVGNCGGSAIHVENNISNLVVNGSKIHDSGTGIFWVGTNTGSMGSNVFTNNGFDIYCQNADLGVTGSGNTAPSCQACGHCPF